MYDNFEELEKRTQEIEEYRRHEYNDYIAKMAYEQHLKLKILDLLDLIKKTCYELQKHI